MTTPDPTDPPTAPQPPPRPGGWRRFVPRRRGAIIGASVVALLVVGAVVAAALVPGGRGGPGFGPGDRHDRGPGALAGFDSGFESGFDGGLGFDDVPGFDGGPGFGPGGPGSPGGPGGEGRDGRPGREGRGSPGGVLGARLGDDTLLAGTVVTAGGGTLALTPDGAPQRSLVADDATRVRGGGERRTVAELTAGERIVVRVDGTGDTATVVGAFTPRARVAGTVTALTGNNATVVSVDGLSVPVDVTGIGAKPAVGDLVVLTGGASGATLRADEMLVMPKSPCPVPADSAPVHP
ncbi:MAG: hypothetical protein ACT4RN_05025, partial [Pseudonocardia sp.]